MKRGALSLMLIAFSMTACNAVTETTRDLSGAIVSPSATPVFNCSYYAEYDSMTDCQTTTFANCDWEYKVFPTGGISACYKPVTGWESCSTASTDWIYTPWTVMCRKPGGSGLTYRVARSTVSCGSTVCACLNPQVVQIDCDDGVDCPVSVPIPSPTPDSNCN
jgi:hypothetical protein